MARLTPEIVHIFCLLHCAAALSANNLVRHRADPKGMYFTKPFPSTISSMVPELHDSKISGDSRLYLVAATRDGGPFHNIYFPLHYATKSALCEIRNFHESFVSGRQCMHWQVDDAYDAEWYHTCLDEAWIDSNEDALEQEVLRRSKRTASLSTVNTRQKALKVRIDGIKTIWNDRCEGSLVTLNMLDVIDSKGLEVVWEGGPNFPEACMDKVRSAVQRFGLEDWKLQRCNIDAERKLEDFPWPQHHA